MGVVGGPSELHGVGIVAVHSEARAPSSWAAICRRGLHRKGSTLCPEHRREMLEQQGNVPGAKVPAYT
jgi:hypothetical protein